MARLTPITSKDQVPANDHAIVDAIVGSRGALQGPFSIFLHSPELAGRVAHLGAFVRFEGSLDMRVRVLAAMTAAREFDAVYVWGAQTGSARRQGVPEATITAIREMHTRGVPRIRSSRKGPEPLQYGQGQALVAADAQGSMCGGFQMPARWGSAAL